MLKMHATEAVSGQPEAKTRKRYQPFYGPTPPKRGLIPEWDGVEWILEYPDIEMIVEMLSEDDRRRYREIP